MDRLAGRNKKEAALALFLLWFAISQIFPHAYNKCYREGKGTNIF